MDGAVRVVHVYAVHRHAGDGGLRAVMWAVRIGSMLFAVAFGTLVALLVLWNLDIVRGRSFWRTYLIRATTTRAVACISRRVWRPTKRTPVARPVFCRG